MKETSFQSPLENYCETLTSVFPYISETRKDLLERLGEYIADKIQQQQSIKLVVICTHNSRRSHIGQLWLQAAALQRAGFEIENNVAGENPLYRVTIPVKDRITKELFSKTFDSSPNPKKDFGAIMVCAEADAGCPFVPGADARFAIPFEDPKKFDGMEIEAAEYDKSVRQIGREFFYAIHYISQFLKQANKK